MPIGQNIPDIVAGHLNLGRFIGGRALAKKIVDNRYQDIAQTAFTGVGAAEALEKRRNNPNASLSTTTNLLWDLLNQFDNPASYKAQTVTQNGVGSLGQVEGYQHVTMGGDNYGWDPSKYNHAWNNLAVTLNGSNNWQKAVKNAYALLEGKLNYNEATLNLFTGLGGTNNVNHARYNYDVTFKGESNRNIAENNIKVTDEGSKNSTGEFYNNGDVNINRTIGNTYTLKNNEVVNFTTAHQATVTLLKSDNAVTINAQHSSSLPADVILGKPKEGQMFKSFSGETSDFNDQLTFSNLHSYDGQRNRIDLSTLAGNDSLKFGNRGVSTNPQTGWTGPFVDYGIQNADIKANLGDGEDYVSITGGGVRTETTSGPYPKTYSSLNTNNFYILDLGSGNDTVELGHVGAQNFPGFPGGYGYPPTEHYTNVLGGNEHVVADGGEGYDKFKVYGHRYDYNVDRQEDGSYLLTYSNLSGINASGSDIRLKNFEAVEFVDQYGSETMTLQPNNLTAATQPTQAMKAESAATEESETENKTESSSVEVNEANTDFDRQFNTQSV